MPDVQDVGRDEHWEGFEDVEDGLVGIDFARRSVASLA